MTDTTRKKIVGLSFPRNNLNLGLEPSILNVLPQGDNVEYSSDNKDFNDADVDKYLCSIYISGVEEFKQWALKHDTKKIIVGGYHPTMFPEEFLNYASKIVLGPCDDIDLTLSQSNISFQRGYYDGTRVGNARFIPGKILRNLDTVPGIIRVHGEKIKGVTEYASDKSEVLKDIILPGILSWHNTPRFDLYDIRNNQQIIPIKKLDDLCTSINTSMGCPFLCDFCCTPVMFGPTMISKPIDAVVREVEMIKNRMDEAEKMDAAERIGTDANDKSSRQRFLFIRDENYPLQKDYAEKLEILSKTNANIYMFASANMLKEEVVKNLAKNNVYMICLGLEDPTKEYAKNKNLETVIHRLKDNGIMTYLSFIVNPLEVVTAQAGKKYYDLLYERFLQLKPEMVCGNFLMPFPGTPIWDKYYHLVSKSDYKYYDSKTPFLVKNELVAAKMRYFMFEVQWRYYNSDNYNNTVRVFDTGDTLHLRFLELKDQFDSMFSEIKNLRP